MKRKIAFLLCALLCMLGSHQATAQNFSVTRKITSQASNEPLPAATIVIKGTTVATTTDKDGNYSISVPKPGSILLITFTGMVPIEKTVNGAGPQNFSLVSAMGTMDEVVVIGYGQQKKSLLTGAISSVKEDQLKTVSNTRIEQALQGRVAGVSIAPQSGQPGAGLSVKIRGTASNGNTAPIYIIDGIKSGGIESLDPAEIASMEILKDGASAAIYGSEGSNGVIIITTKSGKKNSPGEISYSFQYGSQSVKDNYIKMMNASQYQQ